MCVIIFKPRGSTIPKYSILERANSGNHDGAGYMIAVSGVVRIEKGFTEPSALWHHIMTTYSLDEIIDSNMVLHFRHATFGDVSAGNCHPFPLSNNIKALTALSVTCDIGMAHNGNFWKFNDDKWKDLSDTQLVILKLLSKCSWKDFFRSKGNFRKTIKKTLEGHRIVLLHKSGGVRIYGNWFEYEDNLYTSTFYVPGTTNNTVPESMQEFFKLERG